MGRIKENLERIREEIEKACARAGRKSEEVKILAATKTRTPEEILEAYEAGIRLFGENRVQEAREKIPLLKEKMEKAQWHMIGHLQTNKVKYAVNLFDWIETLDRKALADELVKRAEKAGRERIPVLVEVKLSPEESKHGCPPEELEELLSYALQLPRLEVKGFMTVPPYYEEVELVRPFFMRLREIRDRMEEQFGREFPELSMGMSHDFTVAVEEGATIVRIGTALFGPRKY
ncbi:YggS family pyridoxal phosphate-dependent enzyme [Thermovibrio sp.]